VRKRVDPETGRLRAEDAARVYREVADLFGLSASGVILRTPSEIKPTNQETLAFARSLKGKGPRPGRGRRRAEPTPSPSDERHKRRDPDVARLVREAAMEFVDAETGRIPAARATEVYHLLAERFQRTPGTVSNYLKGITPTAQECAQLRWQRERARQPSPGPAASTDSVGARPSKPEPDYSSHPAALFPTPPAAPATGRAPRSPREREAELRSADGRLVDYDEAYQRRRQAEKVESRLDDATQEFLRTFRLQQASEFIDALKECGRAMNHYVMHTERQLQQFQQGLEAAGERIMGVAEFTIQELQRRHQREMEELRAAKDRQIQELTEYVTALEEENARTLTKLREVALILGTLEMGEG
jgi:hypothetical protein